MTVITCDTCGTQLGTADGDAPDRGYLCQRCGAAYSGLVAGGELAAGQTPEPAQVDDWHTASQTADTALAEQPND